IKHAKVIVGDCVLGNEFNEALELRNAARRISLFLGGDPEIKPGVRDFGILLLRFFELSNGLFGFASAQEGQAVIYALARGIGHELEGLPELLDSVLLSGRIFVKSFAEIAVMP